MTDLSFEQPDPTLTMPGHGGDVMLALFGGATVVFLLFVVYSAIRRRSPLPLLFALAGLATAMLEPIADLLGNAQHPPLGQHGAFTTAGVFVPLAVLLIYPTYFGLGPMLIYARAQQRRMTPGLWWRAAAVAFVAVTALEQLPIALDVWTYYGRQPLRLNMPLPMSAANTVAVVLPMLILYRIWPLLRGWRQLLVVGVVPVCAIGAHTAVMAPSAMVIKAPQATHIPWTAEALAGLTSLGFAVLILWLAIGIVHDLFPNQAPVAIAPTNAKEV